MVQDTHNNGYLLSKLGLQGQKIQDDIKHPEASSLFSGSNQQLVTCRLKKPDGLGLAYPEDSNTVI